MHELQKQAIHKTITLTYYVCDKNYKYNKVEVHSVLEQLYSSYISLIAYAVMDNFLSSPPIFANDFHFWEFENRRHHIELTFA